MRDTHVFIDAEGNRHHLGQRKSVNLGRPDGRVFSAPIEELRDGGIEAGLLCLSAWLAEHPGVTLSFREIGYVCGCSESAIFLTFQKALKKLRKYQIKKLEPAL